jgi:uncharacterized protein (TIGR02145 family)
MCIKSKYLLFGFLVITLNDCDMSEPVLDPDYTGQIGQVTDINGNIYKTVGIGSQIWMAQNLNTTKLNDGTIIPQVTGDTNWIRLKTSGYCWYSNDSSKVMKSYGLLYNFYAVNTSLLCPTGWHVPNELEWDDLASFLGGNEKAGGKLKDYYSNYWAGPNPCYANNYGFKALPGGYRMHITGKFLEIGTKGYWWTSKQENEPKAFIRSMSSENTYLAPYDRFNGDGYSVRCIKDQ